MAFMGLSSPAVLTFAAALAGLIGLLGGHWLASVALRLPRLMEYDWECQCREVRGEPPPAARRPRLSGSMARHRPMARAMRAATAVLFAACVWRFGATPLALCAMAFTAAMLLLAFIDLRTRLLPDVITQPLLWTGLLVNLASTFATPELAIAGAAVGYGFLWLVFQAFRRLTGLDGMGQGDFKFLAALGAWFGLAYLPGILIGASVAAVAGGVAAIMSGRAQRGQPQPFGPYLAMAGIVSLFLQ